MNYCAGEELKGTKLCRGLETITAGGDCTGGVLISGNDRLYTSSALNIPCWLVVVPGTLDVTIIREYL